MQRAKSSIASSKLCSEPELLLESVELPPPSVATRFAAPPPEHALASRPTSNTAPAAIVPGLDIVVLLLDYGRNVAPSA
jgi:hypothetical protein